jgi:hypothetical protein
VEKPDRPAASSRPYGEDRIRIAPTQPRIPRRWIEVELGAIGQRQFLSHRVITAVLNLTTYPGFPR